jgi:four helix bundle protein
MKIMEDLDVYKVAFDFVIQIYKSTSKFPADERFGLMSQMRRAAVSIVSNLSECGARITTAEQNHFVAVSRGSVMELLTQIKLSIELGFIDKETGDSYIKICNRIRMMLNGLMKN